MKADFIHASESTKRLNPHLFVGAMATAKPERDGWQTLGHAGGAQKESGNRARTRGPRIEIALVAATHRRLDGDNLAAGFKPLRDAIARSIGLDDNDDEIDWQYGQVRCSGAEGSIVVIREAYPKST